MADSFEFDRQDAVHWWGILESVITKFHADAEKFYCSFYGLLQDNLLPNKFSGDTTLTNILLAETGSLFCLFLSKSECKRHANPLSTPKIISERDRKVHSILLGM